MRVLIVCSYKPQLPDGVAPFVHEQTEALRAQGCECAYYHIKGKGMVGYLREVPKLRGKIREWKPDVIHAHYGLTCLVANLATRRVPVVSTYHGSDINEASVRRISKIAMRLSAWNVFVSKRNMALAGAVEGKKASLVPCGVALSDEQLMTRVEVRKAFGWTVDEKKVLFAGAFDNDVKDPQLAIDAIASLNESLHSMSRDKSLNEPLTLNDVELIELKGYTREGVNRLMCACDCLLMTSKTEGSPQVIKEAMACGCPIVSVDVGDVAERTEGVDGCFVVKSREPKEIASALEKAIAFEGKTNGREKILAAGLTNEQVAKRIIAIYEDIVRKKY